MPKRKLKDIDVTFISLVRAGANKKTIIYKSDEEQTPTWQKEIQIQKAKEGVVYGIVYSPDETDTQGDKTTKEEIKKAAYNFLKQKRVDAIDKNHSFKKEDAFVCESWLIKKGDPLFPKEKEGSWAVGIKIESKELQKEIEDGKIKAISMAGSANVEAIEKASKIDELIDALKSVFQSVNFSISGNYYNRELQKQEGEQMPKENEKAEFTKENLEQIFKDALTPIKEELKTSLEKEQQARETLEKELKELKEAVSKSNQEQTPKTKSTKAEAVLA